MTIHDISQELLSCVVYDGDSSPTIKEVRRIANGHAYNLSDLSICVHNGTHIDAPYHFINDGNTVDKIPLFKTVGKCCVASVSGVLSKDNTANIIDKARSIDFECAKRILLKGDCVVGEESAKVFADSGIYLVGVESQSVGDENHPMAVHKILLSKDVVLLEGIRLNNVKDGVYTLNCTPLNIKGADGSPCRAILIE